MKPINIATIIVILACTGSFAWVNNDENAQISLMVFSLGALGAICREHFNSQQPKPVAAPLVGGISALMLMALLVVFNFNLDLFPQFKLTEEAFTSGKQALKSGVSLVSVSDFYKVIVWSIAAGLSEKFTIDLYLKLTQKTITN